MLLHRSTVFTFILQIQVFRPLCNVIQIPLQALLKFHLIWSGTIRQNMQGVVYFDKILIHSPSLSSSCLAVKLTICWLLEFILCEIALKQTFSVSLTTLNKANESETKGKNTAEIKNKNCVTQRHMRYSYEQIVEKQNGTFFMNPCSIIQFKTVHKSSSTTSESLKITCIYLFFWCFHLTPNKKTQVNLFASFMWCISWPSVIQMLFISSLNNHQRSRTKCCYRWVHF